MYMDTAAVKTTIRTPYQNVMHVQLPSVCDVEEIRAVFASIEAKLDTSRVRIFIVLDFGKQPLLPLVQTIAQALELNYHQRVAGWYIVGQGTLPRSVADVLGRAIRRKPTHYFDDEFKALHHASHNPDGQYLAH